MCGRDFVMIIYSIIILCCLFFQSHSIWRSRPRNPCSLVTNNQRLRLIVSSSVCIQDEMWRF